MEHNEGVGRNRYLAPGTRVRCDAFVNGDDHTTSEFGVVVCCWFDNEIGVYDCYMAFFGANFPDGKPAEVPYVLCYSAVSLAEVAA